MIERGIKCVVFIIYFIVKLVKDVDDFEIILFGKLDKIEMIWVMGILFYIIIDVGKRKEVELVLEREK